MTKAPLDSGEFRKLAGVSRETLSRLELYASRLIQWQRTMNLVSRSSLEDLWRRHMLDSVQLAPLLQKEPTGQPIRITDLGSGAGFPGLVLAIVMDCPVRLVESNSRKCTFLRETARLTRAPAVVVNARIESLSPFSEGPVKEILTARALAPLDRLCEIAAGLGPCFCLFPKGEGWCGELEQARKHWSMTLDVFESRTAVAGRILKISDVIPRPVLGKGR